MCFVLRGQFLFFYCVVFGASISRACDPVAVHVTRLLPHRVSYIKVIDAIF